MPRKLLARRADQGRFFIALDRFLSEVDCASSQVPQKLDTAMIGSVSLSDRNGAKVWDHLPSQQEATIWRAIHYAPYHAAHAAQLARMHAVHPA